MKLSNVLLTALALHLTACTVGTDDVDAQSNDLTEDEHQELLAQRIEIERMYAASVPDDFWLSSKYTVRRLGQAMEVYECLEQLGDRQFYT